MSAQSTDDGAVLGLAARQLGIRVSATWLERTLRSHPAYPAITASLETLNELGLSVQPRRLLREELSEVSAPFLALVDQAPGRLALVTQVTEQAITWRDGASTLQHEAMSGFCSRWKGVALLLRKEPWAGTIGSVDGVRHPWRAAATSLMLMLTAVLATISRPGQTPAAAIGLLFGLKLVGVAACVLLLLASKMQVPAIVRRMCQLGGGQCAGVLRSDEARWWNVGWIDLGAFYFLFGALCILIGTAPPRRRSLS